MLTPEAQRALIGWEPVSSRIITAKFATKKENIKLNVIQCYAPTNDTEDEKKEDFYQHLQTVLDRIGKKDMTILMGDFNAKIGSDNTGYEEVMGKQGLVEMNENGWKFADLCSLNQLVIGGSIFPHKWAHKAKWRSPPCDGEPDRPCMYQQKVQTIMSGCESYARGGHTIRSPSPRNDSEAPPEETRHSHHITHKIQCGIAQQQRSQGAVPAQAIQQVPTTARA